MTGAISDETTPLNCYQFQSRCAARLPLSLLDYIRCGLECCGQYRRITGGRVTDRDVTCWAQYQGICAIFIPEELKAGRVYGSSCLTFRHGFPYQPTAMAFDPVQRLLAVGSKNGSLRMYPLPAMDWANHANAIDAIAT
ncbi:hypothetical protein FOCC_FOCC007381 [Frankliniella occidentalis]|nr:hypothetical protein FOCC_FOCC007381 [Frankliniella occidentalis]